MIGKIVNILLVEDDSLDIMNVERTLKRLDINHKLFIARNGQEAWDMLNGKGVEKIDPAPSVIMLDINMPKMNGLEFLSLLRNSNDFKEVKVFIMTTSSESSDKMLAKKLGVSGYIVKPLNFNNSASSIDSFSLMIDLLNFKKN